MASIAFIGLGKMGAGMASRLLEAGHQVSVYNRTAEKADSVVKRGARLAGSPKEACTNADAVFCMVSDDAASRAIWLGADGILAQSPNAYMLLSNATVLSNATGLHSVSGGNILSYQNNTVTGNVSDGAATGVVTVK